MVDTTSGKGGKKELNFELNLLPVFDILSVCICFLLMTVVWIEVGSLNATQALGGKSQTSAQNPPSVWGTFNPGGTVVLLLKDVPGLGSFPRQYVIPGVKGAIDWNTLISKISIMQRYVPLVKTALIMPANTTAYADIIHLMDQFKKFGIKDVGISPL